MPWRLTLICSKQGVVDAHYTVVVPILWTHALHLGYYFFGFIRTHKFLLRANNLWPCSLYLWRRIYSVSEPLGSRLTIVPRNEQTGISHPFPLGSALGSQQSTLIHSDNVFLSWSTKYTWINNFFTVKSCEFLYILFSSRQTANLNLCTVANVESHTAKGVKVPITTNLPGVS